MSEPVIGIEAELRVGSGEFHSISPAGRWGAWFEDDGDTGYFYIASFDADGQFEEILDALHIYNTKAITDAEKPSTLQIWWSGDGQATALIINGYAHAGADFADRRACCRTNYPPANGDFTDTHEWSDEVLHRFAQR
jgi:hypothetical protein